MSGNGIVAGDSCSSFFVVGGIVLGLLFELSNINDIIVVLS